MVVEPINEAIERLLISCALDHVVQIATAEFKWRA